MELDFDAAPADDSNNACVSCGSPEIGTLWPADQRPGTRFQRHRSARQVSSGGAVSAPGRADGVFLRARHHLVPVPRRRTGGVENQGAQLAAGEALLLEADATTQNVVLSGGGELVLVKLRRNGSAPSA